VALSATDLAFLAQNHSAAMITIASNGVPKVARVGVGMVSEQLWSSGTRDRARTKRLRRDPRCTLFLWDKGFSWLALETRVTLLEGPDAVENNVVFFRTLMGRPSGPITWYGEELDEDRFRQAMVDEGRLIYQFEVVRSYGLE
jgi:Pyridoxamine 5'-phosphate oxidase